MKSYRTLQRIQKVIESYRELQRITEIITEITEK